MQVVLVQPAGSCLSLGGSSYGYTIWCTTLVQLVTLGVLYLYLLHQSVQLVQLALGLVMIALAGSCLLVSLVMVTPFGARHQSNWSPLVRCTFVTLVCAIGTNGTGV